MKQDEKTRQTKEKILNAALEEFGTKGYDAASLNTMCSTNNISKGLIYHNFKNKDELYLLCMKLCFDNLTTHLKLDACIGENAEESIQAYLHLREDFFRKNPAYNSLFFQSLFRVPTHLRDEIKMIRREFDALNAACYQKILGQVQLRKNVTPEEALEYFTFFQEMFNSCYQNRASEFEDAAALAEEHEMRLGKILNFILYGIAKEEK